MMMDIERAGVMKLGSLFDGSGGFPLAGAMCGINPVWASEIEPYPISVTRSRFPYMKHLGSVTDINGGEVEPVDVITFGSPCQDLSVAGKRAGLKHEDHGDEETTRSGLFLEAVRIIKEMRGKSNGKYPSFVVWENVPGAFSSNGGEDFRTVLKELIKIVEKNAVMPEVPRGGWPYADSYTGNGWSIAYRVLDAQYWGVPQRRRRIYLVLDLRGERAGKILFERESLRGYFAEGRSPWKSIAADVEGGIGATNCEGDCIGFDMYNQQSTGGVSRTIKTPKGGDDIPVVCYNGENITSPLNKTNPQPGDPCHTLGTDSRNYVVYKADDGSAGEVAPTLVGDHKNRITDHTALVVEPVYCLQGNGIDRADTAGCNGKGWKEDSCYTLNTVDRPAVAYLSNGNTVTGCLMASGYEKLGAQEMFGGGYTVIEESCHTDTLITDIGFFNSQKNISPTLLARQYKDPHLVTYWNGDTVCGTLTANNAGGNQRMPDKESFNCVIQTEPHFIVRRLTPTECARLQGFPDEWGHPDHKEDFTDEEYSFWINVRNTHAEINGKTVKDYTKDQMLTWYNKLHTDSSEYKMWGNGIALPCALYVMQGIKAVVEKSE